MDESNLQSADPPFLNRFEKHTLHANHALGAAEERVLAELRRWVAEVSTVLPVGAATGVTGVTGGASGSSSSSARVASGSMRPLADFAPADAFCGIVPDDAALAALILRQSSAVAGLGAAVAAEERERLHRAAQPQAVAAAGAAALARGLLSSSEAARENAPSGRLLDDAAARATAAAPAAVLRACIESLLHVMPLDALVRAQASALAARSPGEAEQLVVAFRARAAHRSLADCVLEATGAAANAATATTATSPQRRCPLMVMTYSAHLRREWLPPGLQAASVIVSLSDCNSERWLDEQARCSSHRNNAGAAHVHSRAGAHLPLGSYFVRIRLPASDQTGGHPCPQVTRFWTDPNPQVLLVSCNETSDAEHVRLCRFVMERAAAQAHKAAVGAATAAAGSAREAAAHLSRIERKLQARHTHSF